jgi:hypothetical protein
MLRYTIKRPYGLVIGGVFLLFSNTCNAKEANYRVVELNGNAYLVRSGEEARALEEGQEIISHDSIRVGPDSSLILSMDPSGTNKVYLLENTQVNVQSVSPPMFRLPMGQAYIQLDAYLLESSFEIRTPVALLKTKQGRFRVTHMESASDFAVYDNDAQVVPIDEHGVLRPGSTVLKGNQKVLSPRNLRPSAQMILRTALSLSCIPMWLKALLRDPSRPFRWKSSL